MISLVFTEKIMKFKYKDKEYKTNTKIKFIGGFLPREVIGTIKFGEYQDEDCVEHLGIYVEFEWWGEDKKWSLPHILYEFGNREIEYPYIN